MDYKISAKLLSELLKYLSSKPYWEVVVLINKMNTEIKQSEELYLKKMEDESKSKKNSKKSIKKK